MTARRQVAILLLQADGRGGIPRTVVNLANHLVESYDVRLISVKRKLDEPYFLTDSRVAVDYLLDRRPGRGPSEHEHSTLAPFDPELSAASDFAVVDAVRALTSGMILLSTRPTLNLIAAEHAPPGVVTVGQEHLNLKVRETDTNWHDHARRSVKALDALVTLTEADADDYRRLVPGSDTLITSIPNAISWPIGERSSLSGKVIVAAGRLAEQKAFDRLVDAYAPVARRRPGWQLHIYGTGPERRNLRQRIRDHAIGGQVKLMGHTDDMPGVLRQASGCAMTSTYEGLPMVLLEAMTCGLPMVAYDCPRGPAELIDHGRNGWLIPDGDDKAYTAALLDLIADPERRAAMGRAAWQDAQRYEVPKVVARWRELLDSLGTA